MAARTQGQAPAGPRDPLPDDVPLLRAELQSRIAEADWIKAHYDEQLREAFRRIEELSAQAPAPPAGASPPASLAHQEEMERLRREVERLSQAEIRYLDRIEELKDALARASDEAR